MGRLDVTEKIIATKVAKGVRWADVAELPDPKGDRVKIVMSGKFLSYKTY